LLLFLIGEVISFISWTQMASTTRLLLGGRDGLPPETKHRFVASWPRCPLLFLAKLPFEGFNIREYVIGFWSNGCSWL
jgi:hypothetical protein